MLLSNIYGVLDYIKCKRSLYHKNQILKYWDSQKETKWSQLKNEEDVLNKKNISSQENATETVLSKVEKEDLEKKKISKGSRTRGLEVKEEMTIDEKGTVLDRKIIDSDENAERFPFFETSVIRQPHHFIFKSNYIQKPKILRFFQF